MAYETVIGLEVHAQLNTESKIFCGSSAAFGGGANEYTCTVDLGLPGVLPVLNREVVESTLRLGLAVGAEVAPVCRFARKHYFYPDLPKGYQISQYEEPICTGGRVHFATKDGRDLSINLTRIHMEEDAGKLIHGDELGDPNHSYSDLNRAGVPLLEIVSEPELRNPEDAESYMRKLRTPGALPGYFRRQHAGRQPAVRRQYFSQAGRVGEIRREGGNQEYEFFSESQASARA